MFNFGKYKIVQIWNNSKGKSFWNVSVGISCKWPEVVWGGGGKVWIQEFAKIDKCEIVPLVKMLQLWMSIAIDQRWIWQGDLHQSCSPWCCLWNGAKS